VSNDKDILLTGRKQLATLGRNTRMISASVEQTCLNRLQAPLKLPTQAHLPVMATQCATMSNMHTMSVHPRDPVGPLKSACGGGNGVSLIRFCSRGQGRLWVRKQ